MPIATLATLTGDGISASGLRFCFEDGEDGAAAVVVVVTATVVDAAVVSIKIGNDFDILFVFCCSKEKKRKEMEKKGDNVKST